MRRLIVKMSSIGDVVHTVPAVRALRAAAPGDFLAWIVEDAAYPIVKEIREVDRVIRFPRGAWRKMPRFFRDVRRMRFHQAIDRDWPIADCGATHSGFRSFSGRSCASFAPVPHQRGTPAPLGSEQLALILTPAFLTISANCREWGCSLGPNRVSPNRVRRCLLCKKMNRLLNLIQVRYRRFY